MKTGDITKEPLISGGLVLILGIGLEVPNTQKNQITYMNQTGQLMTFYYNRELEPVSWDEFIVLAPAS